jgi:hypothetical protein
MTNSVVTHCDSAHDHPARNAFPQKVFCGVALAVIAFASGWTLYANLAGTGHNVIVTGPTVTVATARPVAPAVAAAPRMPAEPDLLTAPVVDVAMFDKAPSMGVPPGTFSLGISPRRQAEAQVPSQSLPVRVVQSVPLPKPRPAGLGLSPLQAMAQPAKPDDPFKKLFGKSETSPVLAYAAPDGGIFNNGQSLPSGKLPSNDGLTAIYDITARTVHLPDGTKLEAHSGLGPKMDDPRHVNVRMHGATPPHVYDLVPREALFHGVQALRLIPVGGEGAIFGRTGLLTHTYLLGPRGDSIGCISFKDYEAFLRAYQNGKVKRMVVVASIDDPQLDLRIVERRPERTVRTETVSIKTPPQMDDRYLPAFSSSLASRTN